ncbi:TonB-dependent receptor [Emcibacter nanhaiensis]|uniref:TonB-dependent receptor n=1 Tax=Emcibacter nanhaiensis TaxID=1505037 RepID=A0A501PGR7_9PROT|nr:TonB-dependent receptor [Emcibacter nanhaiensis]TPD59609.1 TonB-dependent receptor [Emcibacter nanhaiensis]TPD62036.1 TonB-dependent receptor [Emcibacter nanhaiensis]
MVLSRVDAFIFALTATTSSVALMASQAMAEDVDSDGEIMVMEEVVVSAQRRDTTILEVPVSVTAIGGTELENTSATSIMDYAAKIPGLNLVGGGTPGQVTLTLRGVSSSVGGGANVATYIDETPVGSSSIYSRASILQLDFFPYDIERLEIVRGPQGTLYGASAMGGLIKYVTKKPNLQEVRMRGGAGLRSVEGGGDLGYNVQGSVSVPLVKDSLGMSVSGYHSNTPGYIDNYRRGEDDINEVRQSGARVALQWNPSEKIDINLSGIVQDVDADDQATIFLDPTSSEPVVDELSTGAYLREPFKKTMYFTALNISWNIGVADLVSSSSYSYTKTRDGIDGTSVYGGLVPIFSGGAVPEGNIYYDNTVKVKKYTQELRLVSSDEEAAFQWILGGFFTDETATNAQYFTAEDPAGNLVDFLNPMADILLDSSYKEYAVYGDVTVDFTDRFELTAGLRWSKNDQVYTEYDDGLFYGFMGSAMGGASSEEIVTYMVSPKYTLSEDLMVYARYATGYRPGGPNVAIFGIPPQVDSDTLDSYEIGLKGRLLDGKLTLEGALFQNDWQGLQVTASGGGFGWLENGGDARVKGLELSSSVNVTPEFKLSFNASYTHTEFLDDAPSLGAVAGDRIPFVPDWLIGATADYGFQVSGGWTGWVSGSVRYVDDQTYFIPDIGASRTMDSYTTVDLRAGFENGPWEVKLFANNLTNRHAHTDESLLVNFFGVPVNGQATILQPRTIGISVGYSY